MATIEKENVWTEWRENESKNFHDMTGSYILDFDIPLNAWGHELERHEERVVNLGKASLHITDEAWIQEKGDYSLIDHVHMDYNDDMNWNEYTLYEYLEDALRSTKYGQEGGVHGTVAVLHKIEILPEFRGNNLFPYYLNSIIHSCRKFKVDFVVLQPHPFGGEGFNPEQRELGILRLRRFYSKFGFKDVPISEGNAYMMLPIKQHQAIKMPKAL